MDKRIKNEMAHGEYLTTKGAGDIWGWESSAGKKRWARRVKMLSSHIGPSMDVLEVGCGTGYLTRELVKTKAKITAIDISFNLLSIVKLELEKSNVNFLIDNACNMSFTDSTFDTAVGSSVLHHLDINSALKELFRVLKPGASIYFTEPNMLNPQIALQKNIPYLKRKMGDSPDETAFLGWDIKKKLINTGFGNNIIVIPFDFLHPRIPNSVVEPMETVCAYIERLPIVKHIAGSLFISATKPD